MTAHRNVQCVVAGIVVSAVVGWLSGCDADSQFREYSQLESAAVEADETNNMPDSEGGLRSATPASAETNSHAIAVANAQTGFFSQPPVAAPVPVVAQLDNGSSESPDVNGPLAVVRKVNPSSPASAGQKSTEGGGTRTPTPNLRKTLPSTVPRQVKILIKERDFKVEGPAKAIRVSYDDIDLLKVLNMEPVTADAPKLMPDWLKGLDGQRIRIRGFMYPSFQETGIPAFLMARDNQICCFGGEAKIYDLFPVRLRKGVTTDYILNRPFDVVGVFHIDTIVDEGELFQLYRIDDAVVIDK